MTHEPRISATAKAAGYLILLIGAYLLLVVLDFGIYKFGHLLPISQAKKDLARSLGNIDYTKDPDYKVWLNGFMKPPHQPPWTYVNNGDEFTAASVKNPHPQSLSWPGTDAFGNVNDKPIAMADTLFIGDSNCLGGGTGFIKSIPVLFESISHHKTYAIAQSGLGLGQYFEIIKHEAGDLRGKRIIVLFSIGSDLKEDLDIYLLRRANKEHPLCQFFALRTLSHYFFSSLLKIRGHSPSDSGWYPVYLTAPSYKNLPVAFHGFYRNNYSDLGWLNARRKKSIDHLFKDIRKSTDESGATVLFAVLPTKMQILSPYFSRQNVADNPDFFKNYPAYVKNLDTLTEFALQELKENGISAVDLRPALRSHVRTQIIYWPEDTHMTPAGNKIVTEEILAAIKD